MKSYLFLMSNRESKNIILENKIWMNGNDFVEDVFIRMIEMLIAKTDYIMLADKFLPIGMKAPLILVSAPNRCETEMSS